MENINQKKAIYYYESSTSDKTSGYFPGLYVTPNYCYNYIAQVNQEIRQECSGPLSL